jgi:D-alanine--poly(phosphoribitol) ligase subunit 1
MDVIGRIDAWATTRAHRIAHVSGTQRLTYADLKTQSDALAVYLSNHLADDRSPVAVVGNKEPEMLVSFLGCIKAGHPYVPLDVSLPGPRIESIVDASNARFTLTPDVVRGAVSTATGRLRNRPLAPSDPYYIMFTSGSTGVPKGVPITLGCLGDFIDWMEQEQRFTDDETFLNQVPYSFDVSIMDTYLGLVTGGTVFSLTAKHIAQPVELHRALAESNVSIWVSTPTFAQMCLADRQFGRRTLPKMKRFMFCGETLPPSIVAELFVRFPQADVWNTYGPTEATVATTSVRVDRTMLARYPSLPIGFAKVRTRIDICDPAGRRLPDGERGEIVIIGPNVSPGYLNRPDADERAFYRVDGIRAYRTGDAGHVEDGMLFFDGRLDNQIKLHGFRIELGDVESHLAALPEVQHAVVLPVTRGGRVESLQAFVVLTHPTDASSFEISNALRGRLAERIPAYMLPSRFRLLETFPMTVNGKIDRRRLAELE